MLEVSETKADAETSPLFLRISEDKLRVLLSVDVAKVGEANIRSALEERLRNLGVKATPDWTRIIGILTEAGNKHELVKDLVLAEGKPAIPSENGRLDWTDDYFTAGYFIDPVTKRIDFHQKVEKTAVEKGQLLVRIIHSKTGSEGLDVFGMPIKISRPVDADLRSGPNIVWDNQEKGYRAKTSGKVRLIGSFLDVDEVYLVKGAVGKDTGNIKHSGQLIVDGNIESDFKVETSGGIEVRGLIYASDIECGGNLTAREGINENISRHIRVKGNILAKYILNANIECGGNIAVAKEVFQSNLKTGGEVCCHEGRIVGGEVISARGITVNEAGSKGNVRTTLIAGINYTLLDKLKKNGDDILRLKDTLKKLTPVYKKLKTCMSTLTAAQKEGIMEISFQITEAEEGIAALEEKNKEIRREIYANKDAHITILGTVYPGVTVRIFDSQYTVENELLGPIVARLDRITGEIALTSELDDKVEKV